MLITVVIDNDRNTRSSFATDFYLDGKGKLCKCKI
jgi:hypothetical protein